MAMMLNYEVIWDKFNVDTVCTSKY